MGNIGLYYLQGSVDLGSRLEGGGWREEGTGDRVFRRGDILRMGN